MTARTAEDIADLVAGTLRDLGQLKFENVADTLQDCPVMEQWLKKDKILIDGGYGIQRTLMTQLSRQASHVALNAEDNTDIPDLSAQLYVPWRFARTTWGYEYRTDILMNQRAGGSKKIFDTLKMRRADAMQSMAEELESKGWSTPASTNDTEPYGIPYWVVYNATTGFNGGLPSGHSTLAGVNLTTHANWKNYTANYTTVSKADLFAKMRTGLREMRWKRHADDYAKPQTRMMIYTDGARIEAFENVGEAQNENLGRDLAPYQAGARRPEDRLVEVNGELMFRRYPIVWVPQLDDTAVYTANTAPIYCIDHSTFSPYVLEGDYLRESKPEKDPNKHNWFRVFVDLSYNYICLNRRRNAIFATA